MFMETETVPQQLAEGFGCVNYCCKLGRRLWMSADRRRLTVRNGAAFFPNMERSTPEVDC